MSADAEPFLRITGRRRLAGKLRVNGAKNAALPCLAAALLTDQPSRLRRVPDIEDVHRLLEILTCLGVDARFQDNAVALHPVGPCRGAPPDHLVAALRASFLVMGPLLARSGEAASGAPGGDNIGARPLDVHLAGFRALGARVESINGRTIARAPDGLRGADIVLDYPSVLGTENLLLAAVLARGRTRIVNAAMEPEVVCLADLLTRMGARISGAGHNTITIDGVDRLAGVDHELIPDRIETGTLLIAAAATRGRVLLRGADPDQLELPLAKLNEVGAQIWSAPDQIELDAGPALRLNAANVQALPYPGFPTDLQAPMTALLTQAAGRSIVHERVFEDRMQHLAGLRQFGSILRVREDGRPELFGPARLAGTVGRGTDIRATAALVVAALAADGESRVYGIHHLARGYADLAGQLRALGADIELIPALDTLTN